MQKIALLAALICCRLIPYCQSKPIKAGDRFVDLASVTDSARYFDNLRPELKDKRLILFDFWNVRCGNCIAAMPKMEALQKEYGTQLQIVLITFNSSEEVATLFRQVKIKKPALPMVVSDTLFNQRFPHEGDPLHIWFDSAFTVRYITEGYNATKEKIGRFLHREKVDIANRSPLSGFDYTSSLLEGLGRSEAQRQRSSILLTGLSNRLPWGSISKRVDTATRTFYFRALNCTPVSLFGAAYHNRLYGKRVSGLIAPDNNNRIICDSTLRIPPDSNSIDQWGQQNLFCYELRVQAESYDFDSMLQQDLSTVLPFTAEMENRKVDCWVLKRNGKIVSGKSLLRPGAVYVSGRNFYFSDLPLSSLIGYLETINHLINVPIIDDTGYKEKVNLILPRPIHDIDSLKKALMRYGLTVEREARYVEMLVIREKK